MFLCFLGSRRSIGQNVGIPLPGRFGCREVPRPKKVLIKVKTCHFERSRIAPFRGNSAESRNLLSTFSSLIRASLPSDSRRQPLDTTPPFAAGLLESLL